MVAATPPRASDFFTVARLSDPSSLPLLDRLFPGLLSDPGFRQLLSLAFLVTNVSKTHIRAFLSDWAVTTQNGTYHIYTMDYFHPRAGSEESELRRWGRTGDVTRFTGNMPLIKAGATRLVTPFFNWSPSHYRKNSKPDWTKLLRRQPQVVASDLTSPGTRVTMTIEGAITGRYGAAGPHFEYLTTTFCVTRNAEHDEAVAVRRCIMAGASPDQVRELLRRDAGGRDFGPRSVPNSYYYAVRQRQAKVLLRRLNNAPWEEFLGTLAYLRNQPKTRGRLAESVSPDCAIEGRH
jgi:hypothetical protein